MRDQFKLTYLSGELLRPLSPRKPETSSSGASYKIACICMVAAHSPNTEKEHAGGTRVSYELGSRTQMIRTADAPFPFLNPTWKGRHLSPERRVYSLLLNPQNQHTMSTTPYDSREDTLKHIERVQSLLYKAMYNIFDRSERHDLSKLEEPEKSAFDAATPRLAASTYGSDEYKGFLADLKPALDHHYANNSHHPEHYGYLECNGCFKRFPRDYSEQCDRCGYGQFQFRPNVSGMSLLDVLEMLCDWKAAGERHADGSIEKSLCVNRTRFEISDQLHNILVNTAIELGWIVPARTQQSL